MSSKIEQIIEEIEEFMLHGDFDGMNVTIPYKETVMPYMSKLSDSAKKIGSVNTVTRLPDGTLYGDNTDYYGFSYMAEKSGIEIKDKKVLILRMRSVPAIDATGIHAFETILKTFEKIPCSFSY